MTCRDLVAALYGLVEGQLSGADELAARRHFAGCPDCAVYAQTYETAVLLGRSLGSDDEAASGEMPEELVLGILAARALPPRPSLLV
jgi:anti-sigma factor RsiW